MAEGSLQEELTDPSERAMHPPIRKWKGSLTVKEMESKFLNPGVHFERGAASSGRTKRRGGKCVFFSVTS